MVLWGTLVVERGMRDSLKSGTVLLEAKNGGMRHLMGMRFGKEVFESDLFFVTFVVQTGVKRVIVINCNVIKATA